jgi:CubicO group peptidase (beta-lactamase class C family)
MTQLNEGVVDQRVGEMLALWDVPGAAVAVVDAREGPLLLRGYGIRQVGGTSPVDSDTVFSIASLTKAFTAVGAASAVDAGSLAWETPVVSHLPYFKLYDPYVTAVTSVRDALCHRVGITQHYHNGLALSTEEMIRELAKDVAETPFRSQHSYHNIMYAAGGEAVAASAGTTWVRHITESVLEPLGMTSTTATASDLATAENVAHSHLRDRLGRVNVDPFRPHGVWSMDNHAPAGAINSTATDMAKWLQFLLGDGTWEGHRVVSEESLAETLTAQACHRDTYYPEFPALAYALGWEVTPYAGRLLRWHMGTFRGVVSVVILSPTDGVGVFVAANSREADYGMAHVALAHSLLDQVLRLPEEDRFSWALAEQERLVAERRADEAALFEKFATSQDATIAPEVLCGDYVHWTDGTYRVSSRVGDLSIELLGCSEPYRGRLEHLTGDAYRADWDETVQEYEPAQVVAFSSNGKGEPHAALLHRVGREHPRECLRRD